MIYVIARAEVAPEKYRDYLDELMKIVPDVRDEKFVTIIEMWESEADWRAHMTTEHMARFKAAVGAWRVGNTVYAVKPL